MRLHTLPSISVRKRKRLGMGHGSGKVKTAGRGTKGQNARSRRSLTFEGAALPLIKRLPFRRGRGLNAKVTPKPVVINLADIKDLRNSGIIDINFLITNKIVTKKETQTRGVKLLGDGEVTSVLTVKIPVSRRAQVKIEKAGGSVVS